MNWGCPNLAYYLFRSLQVSVPACNKRHSIQDTRRRMRGSLTHDEMLSSCLIKRLVILSICIDVRVHTYWLTKLQVWCCGCKWPITALNFSFITCNLNFNFVCYTVLLTPLFCSSLEAGKLSIAWIQLCKGNLFDEYISKIFLLVTKVKA